MTEAPSGYYRLCAIDDLADPGSRGFEVDIGAERPVSLFVVHKDSVVAAYLNSCPHTGAPLEWQPDQFLDLDNSFVQCAIHGALFRPEDGYCLRGPCVGKSLIGLPIQDIQGMLWVGLAELPEQPGTRD